ncbi:hypothetical protein Tco_0759163 [Tanacetum coccineum]
MATLKFADSHNMVVFLSKPAESEGFEQIVDFLNAHLIRYALTVNPTIYVSCIEQFWSSAVAKTINETLRLADAEGIDCFLNSTTFENLALMGTVSPKHVADEAVHKERGESLVRAATTASCLEAEVLDLETTKTTQANEIASLKRRVKKLEKKDRSRTHKLKRLYKVGGGDYDTDADEDITLVNDDNKIFDVDALAGEEVFIVEQSKNIVEEVVNAAQTITTEEITFAQAPKELKSAKPKADKVMIQEPEQGDEQMRLDEELAFKLQAEEEEDEEEERLAREKAQQIEEANIAWDDVQAKVEADYQLTQRLQAQEQEELTDEEKARLFV